MKKKKEVEYIKISYKYKTVEVLVELSNSTEYYNIIDYPMTLRIEQEGNAEFFIGYLKEEKIKIPIIPNYYNREYLYSSNELPLPSYVTKIGRQRIAQGLNEYFDLLFG